MRLAHGDEGASKQGVPSRRNAPFPSPSATSAIFLARTRMLFLDRLFGIPRRAYPATSSARMALRRAFALPATLLPGNRRLRIGTGNRLDEQPRTRSLRDSRTVAIPPRRKDLASYHGLAVARPRLHSKRHTPGTRQGLLRPAPRCLPDACPSHRGLLGLPNRPLASAKFLGRFPGCHRNAYWRLPRLKFRDIFHHSRG